MEKLLDLEVRERAGQRCEVLQNTPSTPIDRDFRSTTLSLCSTVGPEPARIILRLCCIRCNCHKGPNIAGIDPKTGQLTRLFHPRDDWNAHFFLEWPTACGTDAGKGQHNRGSAGDQRSSVRRSARNSLTIGFPLRSRTKWIKRVSISSELFAGSSSPYRHRRQRQHDRRALDGGDCKWRHSARHRRHPIVLPRHDAGSHICPAVCRCGCR